MTDNSAEPTPAPDETALSAPLSTDKSPPATAKWIVLMFMVLAVLTTAAGVYLSNKIHTLESALNISADAMRAGDDAISARINNINKTITDLQAQQEGMAASIAGLHEQQPASNEDWALAEVEFLLTLALHQLHLAIDLQSALATLETAALRLKDLTDPELEPVRQQLAADIEQIKAVDAVDVSGLSIYLADLIDRVQQLPLQQAGIENDEKTGSPPSVETGFSLRELFVTVWNELKGLIVIKRGVDTRQVMLAPEQEYFLYQNLRLELENARLSVMRNDTENLRTSINLLKNWLQTYFDTEDSAVINIIETLDMMAGLDLQPALPDVTSALESLRAWQRARSAGATGTAP